MKTLIKALVIITTILAMASISFAGGKGEKGGKSTREAGTGQPGI